MLFFCKKYWKSYFVDADIYKNNIVLLYLRDSEFCVIDKYTYHGLHCTKTTVPLIISMCIQYSCSQTIGAEKQG